MRLRDLHETLTASAPLLKKLTLEPQPQNLMRISKLTSVRDGLKQVSKVASLSPETVPLLDNPYISAHHEDSLLLDHPQAKQIKALVDTLLVAMRFFDRAVSEAVTNETSLSVAVRVPDTDSLKELGKTVHEFDTIFSQALQPREVFGGFQLIGFDTGSMWLQMALDQTEGMTLILSLAAVARWYLGQTLKIKEQEAEAKRVADAKQVEMITDLFEKMEKAKRRDAIDRLSREGCSPEDRERLGVALDKYTGLVGRGADIVPALSAPPEIRLAYAAERAALPAREPPQLIAARVPSGIAESAAKQDEEP